MERKFVFAEGEYYHLYNRGVEKRKIFLSKNDHERFIRLLYLANSSRPFVYREVEKKLLSDIDRGDALTAIGAYVMMPNHFHLLVKETKEGGISAFMEKLLTGYASYFNKNHDRVGRLFQSTYQARHANRDEYLKYLFAYIHLNPVKLLESGWKEKGIQNKPAAKEFLEHFRYSSYQDYEGLKREEVAILSMAEFPPYFSELKSFGDFVEDWMTFQSL